jgi:hypothetical protein
MKMILLLLLVAALLSGCLSNKPTFGQVCNDNLRTYVSPPGEEQVFCYDKKGSVELILSNYGDIVVQRYDFLITGSKKNFNGTINRAFRPASSDFISINYNRKDIGNILKLTITPTIIFEGENRSCRTAQFIAYQIESCES